MRDPAVNVEVEAAVEEARRWFERLQRLGDLDKGDENSTNRRAARRYIARLTDEAMPSHLREYVCRVLDEAKGRSTYLGRNFWIAFSVNEAMKRGFAPTRNAESRGNKARESACSIVTTALARVGVHLSERTVEDIWGHWTFEKDPNVEDWELGPGNSAG
jgi:hypothetical protein